MRVAKMVLLSLLLGIGSAWTEQPRTGSSHAAETAILYTAAKKFRPLAWLRGEDRFPRGATLFIRSDQQTRKLVPAFLATSDANVSFDAKRVLFSAKPKTRDHWQIWEMVLETGSLHRVITSADDAVRPMYLPDNRIVYARKQRGHFGIESATLDGTDRLQLYYAPGNAIPSDVLQDGRILVESGFPLGTNGQPELYTVYSDGSGIESYRCDHGAPRYNGTQVGSGDIVFTHGSSLGRFTSSLAEEAPIEAPAGEYAGNIIESSAGNWILPYRQSTSVPFSLVSWSHGESSVTKLAESPGMNLVQPARVVERTVPNRHPSGLHDWKTANLLALNSHISRGSNIDANLGSVRLYTLNENGKTVELGTAPVEKDGSFFVQVPGDRPLKFELLDEAGNSVKREAGWMWARSGEQRVCVGCHAGPENAPENAVPLVLLRSTKPVDLATSHDSTSGGGH